MSVGHSRTDSLPGNSAPQSDRKLLDELTSVNPAIKPSDETAILLRKYLDNVHRAMKAVSETNPSLDEAARIRARAFKEQTAIAENLTRSYRADIEKAEHSNS